jgi:hypothetical protein
MNFSIAFGDSKSGSRIVPMTNVCRLPWVFTGERRRGSICFSVRFPVPNRSDCTSHRGANLIAFSIFWGGSTRTKSANGFSSLRKSKYYSKRLLLILLTKPIAELTILGNQC